MYFEIKNLIEEKLGRSIVLESPKERSFGHFALPCFAFAKELKKAPQIIAQEFSEILSQMPQITELSVVGGYLNFFLSAEFLAKCAKDFLQIANGKKALNLVSNLALDSIKNEQNKELQKSGKKILLEFVSANPTGPLHIGHARGAVYGDALLRIGRFLGYYIQSEYYVNDAGAQIGNLGRSIWAAGRHIFGKTEFILEEGCYRGEYILELANAAHNELGEDFLEISNKDELACKIEKLSVFGKEKMLLEIKENLAALGIVFDNFVSEKELYSRWDKVLKRLEKSGKIYELNGKTWLKSTEYGDEKDRVIVREENSSGKREPTYLAGDIIYHADKFERNFDSYINIWGADHHGYIARVKASLEILGYDSSRLEVLLAQMVALLKDGEAYKMSKRAGNFILLKDVCDEIGADALRLVFLSKRADTHLEFDIQELQKRDASNPVYYINYAYARICSLFSKLEIIDYVNFCESELENGVLANFELKDKKLEKSLYDLLVCALSLSKILNDSFNDYAPNKVVDFLKDLASYLHRFYSEYKVLGNDEQKAILLVFGVVGESLRLALKLLGVNAQKSM